MLWTRRKSIEPTALTGEELLNYWQQTKPEMKDRPYIHTHARRFATTINEIQRVSHFKNVLDIAGNSASKHLFKHFLGPEHFALTPRTLDIELEDWSPHVKQNYFDLAICTEVIEHMSADPAHLLWSANCSLRLGGILLLTTPNICSYLGIYNAIHGRAPYHWGVLTGTRSDRHHREYAPKELEELIAVNGFSTLMYTLDVYEHSSAHEMAKSWVQKFVPGVAEQLAKDTIFVVAQKRESIPRPWRIEPIYISEIAHPRDAYIYGLLQRYAGKGVDMCLLKKANKNP